MPSTRSKRVIAAALAASVIALPIIGSAGASGDPIGDKRAEAARVADKLETLEREAEVYTEQYNNAVLRLGDVEKDVAAQRVKVRATQTKVRTARKAVASYAVGAYTSGSDDLLTTMLASKGNAVSQRNGYVSAALGTQQDALDRLRTATADNAYQSKQLHKAKDSASKARDAVAEKRQATQGAVAEQRQVQARVQGELAHLVAQEQARRRAIAIRKAKEAAARAAAQAAARQRAAQAQAAAQARAAATTTSRASSTTSGSSTSGATSTTAARRQARRRTHAATSTTDAPAPPPPTTAAAPSRRPSSGGSSSSASSSGGSSGYVAPVGSGGAAAVAAARSQLGVPYRWAGASPGSGFDCSGLVMWAWAQAGKGLPHSSSGIYAMSRKISISQLQPGDIVAFYSPVSHIGLYIGGGMMIHAPHTGDVVRIASIYADGTPKAGRL